MTGRENMGKLSNLITMIQLLQSGRKYSVRELAEKLEVTPRMVRVYKDDLEKAGIYVDSIQGIYGGYVLNQKLSSFDVGLVKEDVNLLSILSEYINKKKDFIFKKEFNDFSLKIKNIYETKEKNKTSNIPYMEQFLDQKDTQEETKKYNKINSAIKNKNKMKIKYASINSMIKERIIHPCGLFVYNNNWYVSAYCELKNQTRSFILSRIINYKILDEIF